MPKTAHVYALYGCPYCARARDLLSRHRIEFTESFPTSVERTKLREQYGYPKLPLLVLRYGNGVKKAILGSDKLETYFAEKAAKK